MMTSHQKIKVPATVDGIEKIFSGEVEVTLHLLDGSNVSAKVPVDSYEDGFVIFEIKNGLAFVQGKKEIYTKLKNVIKDE